MEMRAREKLFTLFSSGGIICSNSNYGLSNIRDGLPMRYEAIHQDMDVGFWNGPRALGACDNISKAVFFMYPYVFVASLNKHDALLIIDSHVPMERTRNSTTCNGVCLSEFID